MNPTEWARLQGVYPQVAYQWLREGALPVPAVRVNPRSVLVAPDRVTALPRVASAGARGCLAMTTGLGWTDRLPAYLPGPLKRLSVLEGGCGVMSEWVSLGAAGQRLGVSGSDVRRAGYTKVATGRLEARKHEPPAWLRKARARKHQPGPRRAGVSCCVCGTVRDMRPNLAEDYTHLVCGPCSRSGKRPEFPSRPGMILVRTFNVTGYFDGYVHRIATAAERASVHRAAALARAAFLNAQGEPES